MNEVNNIPEGWVETTLGCVMRISSGKARPKTFGNYPVYGGNGILDYADEFNFDNETIIVGRVGAYCGCVYYENGKFWLSDNALGIKSNEKSDIKFLYYYLININLNKKSIGGAQPLLTQGILNQIEIIIPQDIDEQKSIAAILTSFDDKIELLQAQNKTLEELAQTIFKEWFGKYKVGDELPEGWREGKIGDLIEIRRGSSPRPIQDYISDSGYKWLKISDATATDSPYIFEIKEHIITEGLKNTTLKRAGDLVLSNSATPGMPKILAIDTCVHDGWMHFPNSKVSNEYLYLLFLSIRPALVQHGSGSVFTNLKTDILREFDVVISTKDYYDGFDVLVKPIFDKIYNNALQIQNLTQTRDELLPKLMSGEIRVKKQFFENFE